MVKSLAKVKKQQRTVCFLGAGDNLGRGWVL
jgi:hypothetical protein